MRKIKIYLDTSVINFLFADDAPEKKEVTVDFFDNYLNDFDVFISEHNLIEIHKTTNQIKRAILLKAIDDYSLKVYAPINEDVILLANQLKNLMMLFI